MKGKIVLTNARRHEELKRFLEANGFEALIYPFVEIKPNLNEEALKSFLENLKELNYLLFFTGQGVTDFFNYSKNFISPEELKSNLKKLEIWARGLKAKRNLEKEGLNPKLFSQTFKELKSILESYNLKGKRIGLINYGLNQGEVLDFLEGRGAKVLSISLYSSLPPKEEEKFLDLLDKIKKKEVKAIAFMSAIAVCNFFEIMGKYSINLEDVVIGAVGPITAEALEDYGVKDYVMPKIYTAPMLLKALVDKIAGRSKV